MLNNRRFMVLVLIIAMASVFFISCGLGLPVYLSQNISGQVEGKIISLSIISDQDIDLTSIDFGPSLVLFYSISDTNTFIDFDNLTSDQKTQFKDSYKDSVGEFIRDNDYYVFDYQDNSFYLFKPKTSFTDRDYHLNLNSYIQGNRINLQDLPITFDSTNGTITVNSNTFYVKDYESAIKDKTNDLYLNVFASVYASGSYGFVSDLSFIGTIPFTKPIF